MLDLTGDPHRQIQFRLEHQVGDTDVALVLHPLLVFRYRARTGQLSANRLAQRFGQRDILFAADTASHTDHQTRFIEIDAVALTRLGCGAGHGNGRSLPLHGVHLTAARSVRVLCVKRSAAERDHGKRRSNGFCPYRQTAVDHMLNRRFSILQGDFAGVVGNRSRQAKAQLCRQQFAPARIRQQYRAALAMLTNSLSHHISVVFDHAVFWFAAEQPDMIRAQMTCCRAIRFVQYERVNFFTYSLRATHQFGQTRRGIAEYPDTGKFVHNIP